MHWAGLMLLVAVAVAGTANGQTLTKSLGQLHFFDQVRLINYNLNLEAYFSDVTTFENNTKRLEKICREIQESTQCLHYFHNFELDLKIMKKNIEYIKQQGTSRKKRWAVAGRIIGSIAKQVLLGAATATATSYAYNKITDEYAEQRRKAYNNFLEASIKNQYRQFVNEKEERHDNDMRVTKYREYEDVLHSTSLLANRHFRDTNTFLNVYSDNVRSHFFSIIGLEDFEAEIEQIKDALEVNHTIPAVDMVELLEISKISTLKNATNIQISVEIPIFTNENYTLYELIPIPISNKNNTNILDYNSIFFFNETNEIKILSQNDYGDCLKLRDLTICNTLATLSFEYADNCISTLVLNQTNDDCLFKHIAHRNYVMETSLHSVYCHILKPINLKISCFGKNFVYAINRSTEINYDEECEIFEVTNEIIGNTTNHKTIEISFTYLKPNFSIYDNILQNWTHDIVTINRRKIDLLEAIADTHHLIQEMEDAKQFNANEFFRAISDFFEELSFSKWIMKYVLTYLILPLVLYKLFVCCCYRMKRK